MKISGGNALVAGPTASAAGAISYTVTTNQGRTFTIAITASAAFTLLANGARLMEVGHSFV